MVLFGWGDPYAAENASEAVRTAVGETQRTDLYLYAPRCNFLF